MIDFNNKGHWARLKEVNIDNATVMKPLLIQGENIVSVYKTNRDYVVFTTHRIVTLNVQGITGGKKDFTTIPYSKIQTFSVESSGVFDLDCELELYISGVGKIKFSFTGKTDIIRISQTIAQFTLK